MTKVHVEARRYAAQGYTIVLVGHAGHEEVVGTMGEAPEATVLVQSVADVQALDLPPDVKLAYLTQTTLSVDETGGDHRGTATSLPADPRAEEGRHLLRDLEPAVGRQGDAPVRSSCCSSSAHATRRTRTGWSRLHAQAVCPRT